MFVPAVMSVTAPPATAAGFDQEEKAALAAARADIGEFDRVGPDRKPAPSGPEGREGVARTEIDGAPHVAATDASFLSSKGRLVLSPSPRLVSSNMADDAFISPGVSRNAAPAGARA